MVEIDSSRVEGIAEQWKNRPRTELLPETVL